MKMMFKTHTIAQAVESIGACRELLAKIYEKGDTPFDGEDANVLNQSISTLYILMNDTELEWQTTPVYCALAKAQIKLYTQKIKNEVNFFEIPNKKADLLEAIEFIAETLQLLKQG